MGTGLAFMSEVFFSGHICKHEDHVPVITDRDWRKKLTLSVKQDPCGFAL